MVHIMVFGDSITYGAWDKKGGWVQMLRENFDTKTLSQPDCFNSNFPMVYNLGISSDTSINILKRFKSETNARLLEGYEGVFFIFAIGSNDSCYLKNQNRFVTPQYQFKINIERLIKAAKKYSDDIIFIGTTNVDESRTTPIPWNTDLYCTNNILKQYNIILESICKKHKVTFVDIFEQFETKTDYENLLEDGLHPNTKGHKKIFEIVKEKLAIMLHSKGYIWG